MSDQYGYVDDDREDEDDPCDHEEYDTDLLSGRCQCWRCGESWCASGAEMDRELRFQSEYAEAMDRENRRQWWEDLYYKATFFLRPWRRWRARRKSGADDDIPF